MKLTDALKSFGTTTVPMKNINKNDCGTILITGGDGVVAYRVAMKLLATGYPTVRIGVPDVSKFNTTFSDLIASNNTGIQVIQFDWDNVATYHDALKGVTSVFVTLPHHKNMERNFLSFITMAQHAGVNHFVKLSFYHAMAKKAETVHEYNLGYPDDDPFLQIPFVMMHRACDTALTRMSVVFNFTILYASHFMSNVTVYQATKLNQEHRFYGSSNGKGVNYVSPNDIAEVAVRALLSPKEHHRVGYTLTGPTALTDKNVADILGTRLGTSVSFVDRPIHEFVKSANDTDWGSTIDLAYLEAVKSSGVEELPRFVTPDINKVCGHPAESFEEYIQGQDFMTPQELKYLRPISF